MDKDNCDNGVKRFVIALLFVVGGIVNANAQYEKLRDELLPLKSVDRCRQFLGYIETNNVQEPPYVGFYDYFEKFAKEQNDQILLDEIAFIRQKTKTVLRKEGQQRIEELHRLIEQYKKENKPILVGSCYYFIAQTQFGRGEFAISFENSLRALGIFEELGYSNVPIITRFLHDLGLNYYFFRDYEQVIRLMKISLTQPSFSKSIDIQRYNNLGMSYFNLGIKDSALYYLKKTYEVADRYDSDIWKKIVSANLGDYYFNEKDYNQSLFHYRNSLVDIKDESENTLLFASYVNMTRIYLEMDSLSQAQKYMALANRMVGKLCPHFLGEEQQIEKAKGKYYQSKIKYLSQVKDFETALKYKDSLVNSQLVMSEKYNSMIAKMSSERLLLQKNELKLAEKEKNEANERLFYIILISVILIVGCIFYIRIFKSRQRKIRQNERLLHLNRISMMESRQSQRELEITKREISNFINKVNERNLIIDKLEKELDYLKSLDSIEKNHFQNTIQDLKDLKILTDQDWKDFQQNFETLNPELHQIFKSNAFALSKSEIRYLMLVKLGLNNKEMANALGVSDTAIRVTLSRIRKKLGGTSNESPNTLVEKIIQNKDILTN